MLTRAFVLGRLTGLFACGVVAVLARQGTCLHGRADSALPGILCGARPNGMMVIGLHAVPHLAQDPAAPRNKGVGGCLFTHGASRGYVLKVPDKPT
jgi:hypothetical protein